MNFWNVFGTIILAGLPGVFVIGLRMPFMAVFSANAAMAGVVFGLLLGFYHSLGGFIGAIM